MAKVTLNAAVEAFLQQLTEPTELCDSGGKVVGIFHPTNGNGAKPEWKSPFTREELERRRKQRTGRALADIIKDLESR